MQRRVDTRGRSGECRIKPLFTQGSIPKYRMVVCAILAVALLVVDHRYDWLEKARAEASIIVAPIQWLVSLPAEGLSWASTSFSTQRALVAENRNLREQLISLSQRTLQMESLEAENDQYRRLLRASPRGRIPFITARLMMLDNDPFSQQMIVDQGAREGVYTGQPVLDAFGVIGQVISVSRYSSRVMIITDSGNALPVQIVRNGLRFIIQGDGGQNNLDVMDVPNNADVRVGDVLVTSGLGGEFPQGYPVATVVSVARNTNGPFSSIKARPAAQTDRSRDFLLLFARRVAPDDVGNRVSQQSISVAMQLMGLPAQDNPVKDK